MRMWEARDCGSYDVPSLLFLVGVPPLLPQVCEQLLLKERREACHVHNASRARCVQRAPAYWP